MQKIYPVIMCGGSGTRLWPLSRKALPKQYQPIVTDKSMLRETMRRFPSTAPLKFMPPSFVCAEHHQKHILQACDAEGVTPHKIILEPCAKNTAPVAACTALILGENDSDALILLLPADHHIEAATKFWDSIQSGVTRALDGALVTFGIQPTGPETGYGYIRAGQNVGTDSYGVEAFVEKPDLETAKSYLRAGNYSWNSGMFLFTAETMISSFQKHAPQILKSCETAIKSGTYSQPSLFLDYESFAACESNSIDYAIMEKAENVNVISPVNIGWSDIGSWDSIRERAMEQGALNAGAGEIVDIDCKNTLIRSDTITIAAIGLEDIIIVATDDAVLITKAGESQKVKDVVDTLKSRDKTDIL